MVEKYWQAGRQPQVICLNYNEYIRSRNLLLAKSTLDEDIIFDATSVVVRDAVLYDDDDDDNHDEAAKVKYYDNNYARFPF